MTEISAKQLSVEFGVNMTKISRAIKNGDISKRDNPNGKGYLIEISEAQRWVDTLPKRPKKPFQKPNETTNNATEIISENKALKAQVELLREMLEKSEKAVERERENTATERQNTSHWRQQAEATQRLLEDQSKKNTGGLFGWFKKPA